MPDWSVLIAAIQDHRQHLVTVQEPVGKKERVIFWIG